MYFELDYSDIIEIFKTKLKIDNSVKSISHTFMNERFAGKIDYEPYFQRKYVWNNEKASYFIESILLGTEIPPIVLFDNNKKNEVIDGRQRYETIQRFLEGKLTLNDKGLKVLTELRGKKFSEIDEKIRDTFLNTKIRILQFSIVNEPSLTEIQEDKIKKEIFTRYNSGIIALKPQEIDRATYIGDKIVGAFKEKLENDEEFLKKCQVIFMPPRKQSLEKRDRVNYILTRIRSVLAMRFIPIQSYASASAKSEVIHTFHLLKVSKMPISDNLILFEKVLNKVYGIKTNLDQINSDFSENILLFEVLFWAISIVYIKDKNSFDNLNIIKIAADFENSQNLDVFWKNIPTEKRSKEAIFFSTGSHYYMATINRYTFVANYFNSVTNIDFSNSLKDKNKFDEIMCKQDSVAQFKEFKLSKTDPVSATVYDILNDVQNSKFILRPDYQRSEVHNAKQKASYLLESILLGIRIPPIFIYRRKDGVSEVIDGQQRLLSILGFLKEKYKDENGKEQTSNKDGFKLNKLRFLKELNGKDIDGIETLDPKYKDRILDFQIDIVEINEDQNPNFSPIDLFVRLNSKPFPIQENTFEMWNAFMTKCYVEKIKKISSDYSGELFRSNDTRMKNEELITMLSFLAYQKRKYSIAPEDYLSIFVRNQRINIRIDTKSRVTSALGEISRVNDELFNESIDDVIDFIEKLKILCGDKFENFNQLISHTKLNTNSKTNRNFYFLWICLSRTSKDDILNDKEKIFESIQNYFYITQNIVEEDFEINEFKKNMALIV